MHGKPVKFATFAVWQIRAHVSLADYQAAAKSIYVPADVQKGSGSASCKEAAARVRKMLSLSVSFDGEESQREVADLREGPRLEPDDVERLHTAVAMLDHRSWNILRRRFFLGQTLAEVGQALGLSTARVGQLLDRAMKRLHRKLIDLGVKKGSY